jgi:mediator of replication checkpoint protein 1
LKAIEDREDDEGLDFLDEPEEVVESQLDASQQVAQVDPAGPSQAAPAPIANMGVKRKLPSEFAVPNMSHRRRPAQDNSLKKPVGPVELRNSISDLLDEPLVPDSQMSDQSDDDEEEDDTDLGRAIRQHRNSSILSQVRPSIINRLTNSRQNSMSTDDDSQGPSGPMAFHISTSNSSLFKIPNLLRRATTNLSTTSNTSIGGRDVTMTTNENAVRMGGSKRSNIHFQAREAERMKKVREVERRRTEGIRKSVTGKARVSVLGNSLGRKGGGFE